MTQKAYKRRPPRSERYQPEPEARVARRGSLPHGGPFKSKTYDTISVRDPQQPEATVGLVNARAEVDALGKMLRTPVMHVLFIDRRNGSWLRIDWPGD